MTLTFSLTLALIGADPEAVVVEIDGLKSTAPADWKSIKPDNRLRKYQFELPPAEGDDRPGEVAILPNFAGSTESKFARWKQDFLPPEGLTIDQASEVSELRIGPDVGAKILDVRGTWVYKDRPFDPKAKAELRPGHRVVWVIFETDLDSYQIRLGGPEQTVARHKTAFDEWLKAFKK